MSVNKVILIGNLGKDPEIRYTSTQMPVATFSVATNEKRKDPSGNWVDHTEWHRIVAFNKLAEFTSNYLKKGKTVYVEGRLRTNKWQDKDGHDRYTTEIMADSIRFVGGRGQEAESGPPADSYLPQDAANASSSALDGLQSADSLSSAAVDDVGIEDDDIPF